MFECKKNLKNSICRCSLYYLKAILENEVCSINNQFEMEWHMGIGNIVLIVGVYDIYKILKE